MDVFNSDYLDLNILKNVFGWKIQNIFIKLLRN